MEAAVAKYYEYKFVRRAEFEPKIREMLISPDFMQVVKMMGEEWANFHGREFYPRHMRPE